VHSLLFERRQLVVCSQSCNAVALLDDCSVDCSPVLSTRNAFAFRQGHELTGAVRRESCPRSNTNGPSRRAKRVLLMRYCRSRTSGWGPSNWCLGAVPSGKLVGVPPSSVGREEEQEDNEDEEQSEVIDSSDWDPKPLQALAIDTTVLKKAGPPANHYTVVCFPDRQ
jgi:hypothetical protein